MDLTSRKTIKEALSRHGIRPFKGWGQNFLVDRAVLEKMIAAVDILPTDTVLEIGPGAGTLTKELAKKAKKVIAVEKDEKMIEVLKETLKKFNNTEIIRGDILGAVPRLPESYKLVANLPYYIAAPVIRKFLEAKDTPKEMIIMVQKEVAQRITARPPKMNLLAVSVQFYADPEIIFFVSKKSFWPEPKVDGAILKITPRPLKIGDKERDLFFKIVKAGFSQPRKQIANNLTKKLRLKKETVNSWLLENNIKPAQRAETLTIKDWLNLTKNYPQAFVN